MKKGIFGRRRIFRFIIYFLVLLMVLIGVILAGLNWYLQSNKTKLIEQLDALHGGLASFSTIQVQVWQNFPTVSITIDDVTLQDSLYSEHQTPFLELSQIRADFSINKILRDSLEIQSIHLIGGEVNIFTDSDGYSNMKSLFPKKDKKPQKRIEKDVEESFQLLTNKLKVNLSNIDISFTDVPKFKSMIATIGDLKLNLDQSPNQLAATVDINLKVKELAFNTRKGGYLENSQLKGQLNAQIEDGMIKIPMSPLQINEQGFTIGADIYTDGKTATKLYFNNSATDFNESIQLLTPAIREKVVAYDVKGLFPTKTVVEGTFGPGESPRVTVDFKIKDSDAKVQNYLFEDLDTEGRFTNRLYDDERSLKEGDKNTRIEFQQLATQYGPFRINTSNFILLSTPEDTRIQSDLTVYGKAAAVSNWIGSKQFLFNKGRFKLDAQVNGSLNNVNEILIGSHADLILQHIDVLYKPINATFPLDKLVLEKQAGDAKFEIVSSNFNPIHDLNLEGSLKNLPALLINLANQQASSDVELEAKKISWTDFLDYFGNSDYTNKSIRKTESGKKQALKKTISGLHNNFQPQVTAAIDTLTYFDKLLLTNFFTRLSFKDEHTLVLEETTFHYDKGLVRLSGSIDISDPHRTPFKLDFNTEHLNLQQLLPSLDYLGVKLLANMDSLPTDLNLSLQHEGIIDDSIGLLKEFNEGKIIFNDGQSKKIKGNIQYEPTLEGLHTKISIEGKPELINKFYNSEDFLFTKGALKVDFSYKGYMEHIDQLVKEAKVNLSINDSEIYYQPVDVYFPVKEFLVDAHQDNAYFNLILQSDSLERRLDIDGEFDNLHAFLLDDANRSFHVRAEAKSPKFFWQDFKMLLTPGGEDQVVAQDKSAVRESIKALLHTFDPEFKLRFDTFVYSNQLVVENVHTGLQMLGPDTLELEETGFTFHKGAMQLNGRFDLSGNSQAPFEVEVQTSNLDIASLMRSLDYLGVKSLQEAKYFAGNLSMQLNLSGIFDGDRQNLMSDATKGFITFDLQDVELEGFKAIDTFAEKIHKERRFADIRFASLNNTIAIRGSTIDIPLMEIQSNAIHLFIEGAYDLNGGNSNLWISVPLNNLKKPDLSIIPEKTGYVLAGKKVYLEFKVDPNTGNGIKFRTSKKKFYKERGILKQYKIDKRQYRQLRKVAKRQSK